MAKTLVGALALATLPSAFAFRNTSPFFLFSTTHLNIDSSEGALIDSSKLTTDILESLKDCPSRSYLLVEQAGASSADYSDGHATPRLTHSLAGKQEEIKSSVIVPEVVGAVDTKAIVSHLKTKCGAQLAPLGSSTQNSQDTSPRLIVKSFKPLSMSPSARITTLRENDQWLDELVLSTGDSDDYTVIYTTTAQTEEEAEATLQKEQSYQMEDPFAGVVQMELKRDTSSHMVKRASSSKEGGLFEKYQYFTPGLFMGFAAIIPLFLILLVGIRALTSLEVSYFAFSKEMGPNAQKKQ